MGIKVITVEWGGQTGTINEREAFEAADAIEDHVTIFDLVHMMADPRNLRVAKLAAGYAALCKVAGIKADAQEIRKELASSLGSYISGDESAFAKVAAAIQPLYAILTDGAPVNQGETEPGNEEAPAS